LFTILPLALGIGFSLSPFTALTPAPSPVAQTEWHAQIGDRIVVDTQENQGYLIHSNGRYLEFPVATGRRSYVCYIGRCYNATTPVREWRIASKDIKGDHMTFGPSGRFLRLYYKDESTPYGFHEYGNEESMFDDQPRFKSMGCIIVKRSIMDILDRTFAVNEGKIDVVTKFGVTETTKLAFAEREK